MTSPNDIKFRQLIWTQYRAGNDKQQALINIKNKLGSASATTIDHWYKRFQFGETSLFDEDTDQYYIPRIIQTLPNGYEV
jgi:hypothetical protein